MRYFHFAGPAAFTLSLILAAAAGATGSRVEAQPSAFSGRQVVQAMPASLPQLQVRAMKSESSVAGRESLAGLQATGKYFVQPTFGSAFAVSAANPELPPPGVNIRCKLTFAHPYPIVLVPGTFENMEDNWGALGPLLANNGYCVYSLNYGAPRGSVVAAIGPVPASAKQVATFVRIVQMVTHAPKVDLIGHSQGGMLIEYYAKLLGGARNIHNAIGLAPPTHGTTLDGFVNLAKQYPMFNSALVNGSCRACYDQESGSSVLRPLDAPPIAQRGVKYTIIETTHDTTITPPTNSFIMEPGVTNEYVQNFCSNDMVDHQDLDYDLATIQLVFNVIDPAHAVAPNCALEYPLPA